VRLSVPGNILLLGEYAVLEEGGLGLAMAVDRRARITCQPSGGLAVTGSWPGSTLAWTPREPDASPIVTAAVAAVEQWQRRAGAGTEPWKTHISVDSSAFFLSDGRKSGLGSSAAVTVGIVCALLDAAGRGDAVRDGTAALLAIQAHRNAQGGAGSGYDVTCSFHGGLGLFRGGALPSWEPCTLPWLPTVYLFTGKAPVSSPQAVRRYTEWKERSPGSAREFLDESNRNVLTFIRASTAAEALQSLGDCKRLGISLGAAIGVSARLSLPPGLDERGCKAVGAGNELGACLLETDAPREGIPGLLEAPLSRKGVLWED
jgi:phosphomevalonate kinase